MKDEILEDEILDDDEDYKLITYEELGWERICAWGGFGDDFEVIKYKDTGKYQMFVETMLGFDSNEALHKYVRSILDTFTTWMIENGYDTSKRLNMYQVFTTGLNINSEFDSLEELYATLHLLVNGFSGSGLIVNDCKY